MQYRKFGQLNFEVSALGFGAMRLSTVDNNPARIDEAAATEMMHTAIDKGINYIDTAFPYHAEAGEAFVGHIGFSFHDQYPVFERILDEYDRWEFCQIQYNFMDVDFQAGRKGLREAYMRGLRRGLPAADRNYGST